jgi:hypothetical protein
VADRVGADAREGVWGGYSGGLAGLLALLLTSDLFFVRIDAKTGDYGGEQRHRERDGDRRPRREACRELPSGGDDRAQPDDDQLSGASRKLGRLGYRVENRSPVCPLSIASRFFSVARFTAGLMERTASASGGSMRI